MLVKARRTGTGICDERDGEEAGRQVSCTICAP